ncbi:MAG: hypothetical protein AAFP86_07060, partial [Planctomycetota bacterium]
MEFDPLDGAVVDLAAVDVSALGGAPAIPVAAVSGPRDELWVSDLVSDAVLRFDGVNFSALGALPSTFVNPRGIAPFEDGVLIVNSGFVSGSSEPGLV